MEQFFVLPLERTLSAVVFTLHNGLTLVELPENPLFVWAVGSTDEQAIEAFQLVLGGAVARGEVAA